MSRIASIVAYKYVVVGMLPVFAALGSIALVSAQPPRICSGICDLAWSPVEENLFGAVDEFGLWLYNMSESDAQFFPHEYSTSLSFDPIGRSVAVTSCPALVVPHDPCNGMISLFNLQEQSWTTLGAYDYSIRNVKFSQDGRYIAFEKDEVGAWGIQLIDLTTNDSFSIVDRNLTNFVIEYAFDSRSNYVAVSNGDYGLEGHAFFGMSVWRLSDQTLEALTEDFIFAADLTFVETDTAIMSVEYDSQISVWYFQTSVISSHGSADENLRFDNTHRLSFSYPPAYLLTSLVDQWLGSHRKLFIWDVQSGEQVFFRDTPDDSFTDLITINSTGEYVAYSSTVNERKIVGVWERTTSSTHEIVLSQ